MSERIVVDILGEPCAQGRPRFARRGAHVVAYDPAKSRNWKAMARDFIGRATEGRIAFQDGPLRVTITAIFTCPKGDWRKEPRRRRLHPKRPDAENVAKAVLDAGTGLLWRDDSQVADLRIVKWIGAQGEAPFVRVEVEAEAEVPAIPSPSPEQREIAL